MSERILSYHEIVEELGEGNGHLHSAFQSAVRRGQSPQASTSVGRGRLLRMARSRDFRSVAKLVMDRTSNLQEVVEFVLDVFRGGGIAVGQIKLVPTFEQRRWAAEWLADRAIGKPVQAMDLNITDDSDANRMDFSKISDDDLRTVVRAVRDARVVVDETEEPVH